MGVAQDVAELAHGYNISDYVGLCRDLDLQGLRKRMKDIRERLDNNNIIEKIIMENEEARRLKKMGDGGGVKNLLDIVLDISEDEEAEIRLTETNIKGFILGGLKHLQ
ncbi:PREDICTED: cytochrome P450 93A3-like [Nelumbo nucifera]|uniref:Cytochrome P450 93A3-like n=1 Tax=Nelumbo nucifera TaxID=4432 RepID=A0A1U8Q5L9_NELNU|nr:PREDICTED: cytochrome P450 93A3-like [Nelumbo nucifera]